MKERMRTPYFEGLATHDGPESCVGDPRGRSEALTGVHVGRAIEPRNSQLRGAHAVDKAEGNTAGGVIASRLVDPARSENQGMRGAFMRENREIP